MVEGKIQQYSPEEEQLFYLLRTQPKDIKVRELQYSPKGEPFFNIFTRTGVVVNFATSDREFYLASHEQDLREDKLLKPPSKIYLDFRNLDEETLELMGQVMTGIPLETKPDFCVGIPTTGEKIAEKFSKYSHVPLLEGLYKKVGLPDGGTTLACGDNAPEGNGSTILIVDDVISKGTNSIPALNLALERGFQPTGLMVLIDRQQGGAEYLESMGYLVHFWKNIKQFLHYYSNNPSKEMHITQKQYKSTLSSLL